MIGTIRRKPPARLGRPAVRLLAALVLAALALAGCGGSDSTTGGSGGSAEKVAVKISDFTFKPARITVPAGSTVTFTNEDPSPHTATSKRSGAFDTGRINKGQSKTITLGEAGTFAYYCVFHPFMKGTITVE